MIIDGFDIFWFAIGRQPHDFVLARIDLEPGVVGKCRVQQPDRMREWNFPERSECIAFTEPSRCGCPFAHSIHAQYSGFLIGRGEKSGGCMRLMMFAEQKLRQLSWFQTWSASQDFLG